MEVFLSVMHYTLRKGLKSVNGQIEILDSDSLCYLVKNTNKGVTEVRTISKSLLDEYINFFENNPSISAEDARKALSDKINIYNVEYDYSSTLTTLAKMVLGEQLSSADKITSESNDNSNINIDSSLQIIYYGAPGTGKSHRIKQACSKYEHYRITFHPDTDYASFVGSYKPITHTEQVYTNMGDKAIALKDSVTGEPITTTKITYQYVYQAFLNAYIAAWRQQQNEKTEPVFLVIEEINRGNCAQIFGDIFQLLDRNDSGFSEYPIVADNDLKKELAKEFATLDIAKADDINGIYGDDIVAKVKSGTHLLLPNNLYIWATMNTSDQSLFPIDSAFKRRWDWKYIKITDSGKGYRIAVNGNEYDWWDFVYAINEHIGITTSQEDKKLGYFFVKSNNGIIPADKFLGKVLFFLYGDVYKDYGFDDDIFKGDDEKPMEFSHYFDEHGNADEKKIEKFIQNLGLNPIVEDDESDSGGTKASTRKNFSVIFLDDNKTISGRDQTDTLIQTVNYLGLKTVEQLGILGNQKIPLLSQPDEAEIERWDNNPAIKKPQQIDGTSYYLATQMSMNQKITKIKEIAKKLNRSIKIEISQ